MITRHPLPRLWLFTDERMGDEVLAAIAMLPKGHGGVIFRHYATEPCHRRHLLEDVSRLVQRRRLCLLIAGPTHGIRRWRYDGRHGWPLHQSPPGMFRSVGAHNLPEIARARQQRAGLIFLSPLFATSSHPDSPALGPVRFARLARQTRIPIAALGGVDLERFRKMRGLNAYGFGAIDAWIRR